MIRGTTPTLEFVLPFDTDLIAECFVTLSQNNAEVVTKRFEDCTFDGRNLSVALTQEDTLKLAAGVNVEIQVRIRTTEDNSLASDIYCLSVQRILKEGEI